VLVRRKGALAENGLSSRVVTYEPVEIREPVVSFGDRLAGQVERRQSQLVLGLDPDPSRLWPHALELVGGVDDPSTPPAARAGRAARAIAAHCRLLIDAAGDQCVAVKPQVACFERLGAHGWEALAEVVGYARAAGLLVIADAKRGDVDVSAAAYAQAFFGETQTPYGPVAGLGVDALTVSPWLGADSLAPFVEAARRRGSGLFVLARNSNPGAADLQDRELAGGTVSEAAATMIATLGAGGIGRSGLSDVGAVVGATAPHQLERLRALMPNAIFLLPGVGAQGGQIATLAPAFAPGRAGGLVTVSRGIAYAFTQAGGDPADGARRESERLRDSVNRLVSRS
jgi:orotidine-5'-phosphate decarboxylase